MRIYSIVLALVVAGWSALALYNYSAPINSPGSDLELRCRYGICEDRDMALIARYKGFLLDTKQDPEVNRRLLLQSPASPELWCDYAEALGENSRSSEAAEAFDHAVSLAPNSPPILIRAATAMLIAGKPIEALPLFRRIFEKVPDYPADGIFSLCERFGVSSAQVNSAVLPESQANPATAYLRYLIRFGRTQDAAATWSWILSHTIASRPLVSEYASYLLAQKAYPQAYAIWSGGRSPLTPNLLADPDFESPSSDPPFGWNVARATRAFEVERDASEHHSGNKSLRIQFSGQDNVAFREVSQLVVSSATSYRLSAWIRTAALTTNEGVHLAIEDAEHPSTPLWISDPSFTGTEPWHHFSEKVSIPPKVSLIRLVVLRYPSSKIESKISGTIWLDDFDLRPTP